MAGSKASSKKHGKLDSENHGNPDEQVVKKGDIVKIEYEGKLEDGTVFDSTARHNGELLEFEAGAGRMIKGFDDAVIGMKKGEEKTIRIRPEEAYGHVNPVLIQKLPRDQLPKEPEPKAGMMLVATMPGGEQIPTKIAKVEKDCIILDFNHPLAGKTLVFKIKVADIKEKKE
jgi:FKBP-type peptidyl-prolyl cis-trans isomerase 2